MHHRQNRIDVASVERRISSRQQINVGFHATLRWDGDIIENAKRT
jgi:hypothetical protein